MSPLKVIHDACTDLKDRFSQEGTAAYYPGGDMVGDDAVLASHIPY